jgi:Cof subfamily protein (haloacid dehalogenase superfamily)
MKIKLVASDIGGTLMRKAKRLPAFTAEVLNRLVKHNVPVALLTGYNYHTTRMFTRNLDEKVLLIMQNGTLCTRGNTIVWEYRFPAQAAKTLHDYLETNNLPVIIYKGKNEDFKNFYVSKVEVTLSKAFQRIPRLTDFENITGISTLLPEEMVPRCKQQIEAIAAGQFPVIYSRLVEGSWLEVVHPEVRKDLALKRLCRELSIPLSEVVYCGDNLNDLEVLRIVGHPVLVENAEPELKEEFTARATIVPSVYAQGVAHYLNERFQLGLAPV